MKMKLTVVQPFGGRAIGDEITDEAEVKRVLASEQVGFVVQVVVDAPAVSYVPVKPAK